MKRTDYGYADLTSNEIYKFRKTLGMSQAKLSRKLGLSLRTWCHYEYGTQKMPVSVHMALQFLQKHLIQQILLLLILELVSLQLKIISSEQVRN